MPYGEAGITPFWLGFVDGALWGAGVVGAAVGIWLLIVG